MADIYCPKCGEPFDQAELHDWNEKTYSENLHAFQTLGCAGIEMRCNDIPNAHGSDTAMVAGLLYDMLGDDIDCMDDMMDMARDMGLDVNT
jgi:hypothetical protein